MNFRVEDCTLPPELDDAILAVKRSGLFEERWYETRYPDVTALAMDSVGHYVWLGIQLGRMPAANPAVKTKVDGLIAKADPRQKDPDFLADVVSGAHARGFGEPANLPAGSRAAEVLDAYIISGEWPLGWEAMAPLEIGPGYLSTAQIEAELATLRTLGKFDPLHYVASARVQDVPLPASEGDPDALLRHFLLRGISEGLSPNAEFEVRFYTEAYSDIGRGGFINPYVHYIASGWREGRLPNSQSLEAHMAASAALIDLEYYKSQVEIPPGVDALRHYFLIGRHLGAMANKEFCAQYYLSRFPDIAISGIPELSHYMSHGKQEGRSGRSPIMLAKGAVAYDLAKPTIVIVNHEASETGAPILGLALVRAYARSHNVITHCLKGGPLLEDFLDHSVLLAEGQPERGDAEMLLKDLSDKYALKGIIANSVESGMLALGSLIADVPCVSLIHEFVESTSPAGKMSTLLASTDRAIVPAKLVRASAVIEAATNFVNEPRNITVRPQGYIAQPKDAGPKDLTREEIFALTSDGLGRPRKIVLGGGYVQIRKGTDLFIQTAQQLRRIGRQDFCFLWIGAGYQPDTDLAFSIWLKTQIDRADLEDVVKFLPSQANFKTALEACDVFYLPSRLDPFPNVVVDALAVGKPVVCFENGTGVAELFAQDRAEGSAVAYCDITEAARAIAGWLDREDVKLIRRNTELIDREFLFSDYTAAIDRELAAAIASRRGQIEQRKALVASALLDLQFHIHDEITIRLMHEQITADYVAKITKGLLVFNPRPGFSDGLYLAEHPEMPEGSVPMLEAVKLGKSPPATHVAHDLDLLPNKNDPQLRIALHLHLHYADLSKLFVERLGRIGTPIDVLVTTSGHQNCVEVNQAFNTYRFGRFEVIDVPNVGRDIGPFMTEILPRVADYDLVGHFHGKKTLWHGGDIGQKWRDFLLENLMGDAHHMKGLFNLFSSNRRLGLLFAEDRKAVGWATNLDCALAIAKRLDIGDVPGFPVFPIGTMFWARPKALAGVVGKLDWGDYPSEPLATDGTILHALERLIPTVCRSAGFDWETVYRRGVSW